MAGMYTQCPDCQTTFRVKAKVLQQAAGRVRCGGCGKAFNALENLSEEEQDKTTASEESTQDQNKELLETLDKLAGPEVRIEDTGVEWRVMDEDKEGDTPPTASDEGETGDTSSPRLVAEGDAADQAPEQPVLHGRHDDLPQPVADTQETIDFPATEEATNASDLRFDDNTVLPDDFGNDEDSDEESYPVEPEAPKRRASDREAAQDKSAFDEAQVDLALGEADDWVELLDEVNGEEQPAEEQVQAEEEPEAEATDLEDDSPTDVSEMIKAMDEPADEDMPSDIDTQFLKQAEDMGLDTGSHKIIEDETEAAGVEEEPVGEDDEDLVDEAEEAEDLPELTLDDDDAAAELESTDEFEAQIEAAAKALDGEDVDEQAEGDEERADESEEPVELELEEASAATPIEEDKEVDQRFDEDSNVIEAIVLEGDTVHDAIQEERRKSATTSGTYETPGPLVDTYALNRGKIRGGRRAGDPPSYTVIASVIVLGLVLVGQVLHQSRKSLATYGAFNHTIGPIYRALGKPVTPVWDIRGWQFEATNGSVDENEELLTIYSRIANKSSQALPYPLVHVSLTDRWEDIIGSRVLEPSD
ncbi:MAG: DUF3426 domain-containing protein, partial [Woeseiaceae bacterium]